MIFDSPDLKKTCYLQKKRVADIDQDQLFMTKY